jgi:hypothetical protein
VVVKSVSRLRIDMSLDLSLTVGGALAYKQPLGILFQKLLTRGAWHHVHARSLARNRRSTRLKVFSLSPGANPAQKGNVDQPGSGGLRLKHCWSANLLASQLARLCET